MLFSLPPGLIFLWTDERSVSDIFTTKTEGYIVFLHNVHCLVTYYFPFFDQRNIAKAQRHTHTQKKKEKQMNAVGVTSFLEPLGELGITLYNTRPYSWPARNTKNTVFSLLSHQPASIHRQPVPPAACSLSKQLTSQLSRSSYHNLSEALQVRHRRLLLPEHQSVRGRRGRGRRPSSTLVMMSLPRAWRWPSLPPPLRKSLPMRMKSGETQLSMK